MAGRKPIPRNLRLVTGNTRPDRLNDDEPIVAVEAPPAPDHLDEDAVRIFDETAQVLAGMRVMSAADTAALAIYATTCVRMHDANEKVKASGMVVMSSKRTPMKNPYLIIAQQSERDCMRILAEFGLTPSSRTRVSKQ